MATAAQLCQVAGAQVAGLSAHARNTVQCWEQKALRARSRIVNDILILVSKSNTRAAKFSKVLAQRTSLRNPSAFKPSAKPFPTPHNSTSRRPLNNQAMALRVLALALAIALCAAVCRAGPSQDSFPAIGVRVGIASGPAQVPAPGAALCHSGSTRALSQPRSLVHRIACLCAPAPRLTCCRSSASTLWWPAGVPSAQQACTPPPRWPAPPPAPPPTSPVPATAEAS